MLREPPKDSFHTLHSCRILENTQPNSFSADSVQCMPNSYAGYTTCNILFNPHKNSEEGICLGT